MPGAGNAERGPATTRKPRPQGVQPPSQTKAILPGLDDATAECRGCGAVTELVQGSDYCWDCTYEPLCLCAGHHWHGDTQDTYPGGFDGRCA